MASRTIRLSDRYSPLPTQLEMHRDRHRYRAYIGGVGGGKTLCGTWEAFWQAISHPGTLILIGRQYYTELEDTTMRTFFQEVCPPQLIERYHKSDKRVTLKPIGTREQSEIVFRPLDDFKRVKSMKLGGFFIDEVDEVAQETFYELARRLRHHAGPQRGWVAGNDEGRNWVYHLFHPHGNHHNPKFYKLFVAYTKENFHLPPGYIESLYQGMPPEMVMRYLEPQFQLLGGAIYPEWDPQVHVIDPMPPEAYAGLPKYRVIDPGITSVTCCLTYAVDGAGRMIVLDEFYEPDRTVSEAAAEIRLMCAPYEADIRYNLIDPSAFKKSREKFGRQWSIADEYAENGIFCMPANNDVPAGINVVKQRLHQKTLLVQSNCRHLQEEFADYEWQRRRHRTLGGREKERPKKVHDHAMDAIRYACSDRSLGPSRRTRKQKFAWEDDDFELHQHSPPDDWMTAGFAGAA